MTSILRKMADHEDALWYDDRHPVMDERGCDHEQNGIRIWLIL
jgi:hypothetical protein